MFTEVLKNQEAESVRCFFPVLVKEWEKRKNFNVAFLALSCLFVVYEYHYFWRMTYLGSFNREQFCLGRKLWDKVAQYVFENIYLPAAQSQVSWKINQMSVADKKKL